MSSNFLTNFLGGLTAATNAGKLPSTKQSNELANWLLKSPLLQLEASAAGCGGNLSENGSEIISDLRELVQACQAAATEKNGDDILQEALFTLSRASRQQTQNQGQAGQQYQAQTDPQDFVGAFRIAIEAFLGGVDMNLRDQGRYSSGRDQSRDAMQVDDRETGYQAGQRRAGEGAVDKFDETAYRIAERAQNDPEYRRSIDTLFSIYDQFKTRSINRAQRSQRSQQPDCSEIEEELADILGGGQMSHALKNIRTLVERFAGGKSLKDVFAAAANCAADLREDQDVRRVVDESQAFIRQSMEQSGYIESNEYRQRRMQLREQWKRLQERNSEAGRKWNQDVERLQQESREFNKAVEQDRSSQRVRNAYLKLSKHLASAAPIAGKFAMGQSSWLMSDIADAALPRAFSVIKNIPLPRTEIADEETEFVLENLTLESLQLQPGRVKITNQASPDDAQGPSSGQSQDMLNKTRIQFSGLQAKLGQASFYHQDKTARASPRTITGLLDITIPQKGLDVDIQTSMLSSAPGAKQQQREQRRSFLRVDQVSISLDDVQLSMSKTNHPVATTLLKPMIRTRLLTALKTSLEQYLRVGIETLDGLAHDVHDRAQVFADASSIENSLSTHVLSLVSALGRMAREGQLPGMRPGDEAQRGGYGQQARQKVMGEGVPAEAERFTDLVARQREAEIKREGWRSGAYELPAGGAY